VRLVYRKSGERSHAAAAFLASVEEKKKSEEHRAPRHKEVAEA
jgi:hypothetical protein